MKYLFNAALTSYYTSGLGKRTLEGWCVPNKTPLQIPSGLLQCNLTLSVLGFFHFLSELVLSSCLHSFARRQSL